ncbi:MAG: toll/interleukin-1 receptor domain-containing protein [Gemmatimonadaceae bacterium]|jgi:hypothetical protein
MPPTAFLSYSHDSADHKAWVLRLATDLRASGVDARLDRWHLRPGEEAGPFMSRAVADSAKIVVVCSETYVQKSEARVGGAGYESVMVTAELVADQGTSKFIPVLRSNEPGSIPSFLAGRIYVDFRVEEAYEESLTVLLRAIHDLPAIDPPPVGQAIFAPPGAEPTPAATITGKAVEASTSVEELEVLLQAPHRRIQLSKLLWGAVEAARARLLEGGLYSYDTQPTTESVAAKAELVESAMGDLAPLLSTMGAWASREQIPAAAQIVAHLLDLPEPTGAFYEANQQLARYPALLALYAAGLGGLSQDRPDNLRSVLLIGVPSLRRRERDSPFVEALHEGAPFAQEFWRRLPDMDRRYTPLSDRALGFFIATLPGIVSTGSKAERLFDRLECTVSLAYIDATPGHNERGWAPLGSYMWRDPGIVDRLQEDLARLGADWPLIRAGYFSGSVEQATAALDRLRKHVVMVRQQRGVF